MRILKKIWRPILALALLFVLVKKGPFNLQQLQEVILKPDILVLGIGTMLLQILLFTWRWKLFVDQVTHSKYFQVLKLTLIGMFFNFFIPGGVGGDIVKALELSKDKSATRAQTLSTVMSDRVFGLFAMLTFSSTFLIYENFHAPTNSIAHFTFISVLAWLGMTATLLFFPFIFSQISKHLTNRSSKIFAVLEKLINSLRFTFTTFHNTKIQFKSLAVSLIAQMAAIYFMYYVVVQLNTPPPSFLVFFSLCCFGFVASALPIMPGGIGVGQYAFYVLFSPISPELGQSTITAITILQVFQLMYALIGGLIFSLNPKAKKEAIEHEAKTIN